MAQTKEEKKAYQRAYYIANKEKVMARAKAWDEANKEKVAARKAAWSEANRERLKANRRSHYVENRDAILSKQKEWRDSNKEIKAKRDKAYREANKESISIQKRAYREANKEKIAAGKKAYREANKEKIRAEKRAWFKKTYDARKHRYRKAWSDYNARKKAAIPASVATCEEEKRRVLQTYRLCALLSKATGVEYHVDHMWPLADGGPHWSGNLQVIPAEENLSKSASVCEETKNTIIKSLYTFESERAI